MQQQCHKVAPNSQHQHNYQHKIIIMSNKPTGQKLPTKIKVMYDAIDMDALNKSKAEKEHALKTKQIVKK